MSVMKTVIKNIRKTYEMETNSLNLQIIVFIIRYEPKSKTLLCQRLMCQ